MDLGFKVRLSDLKAQARISSVTGRDPVYPHQSHNPGAGDPADAQSTAAGVDKLELDAQVLPGPHHPQALLGEVVVDVRCFHGQVAG